MYSDPNSVKRIASIGAGPIGAGWTAHFLARGYDVTAYLHDKIEEKSFISILKTALHTPLFWINSGFIVLTPDFIDKIISYSLPLSISISSKEYFYLDLIDHYSDELVFSFLFNSSIATLIFSTLRQIWCIPCPLFFRNLDIIEFFF